MKPSPAVDETASGHGDALTPALREHEKLIDAFAKEFSFASDKIERLKKSMAKVMSAWRLNEARHREKHHQTRAKLNVLTNGQIERWISASTDADLKTFFNMLWRDAASTPRKQSPRRSLVYRFTKT